MFQRRFATVNRSSINDRKILLLQADSKDEIVILLSFANTKVALAYFNRMSMQRIFVLLDR